MARVVMKYDQRTGSASQKSSCSRTCLILSVKTLLLILLYFTLSIGLTFYQRTFLQTFHFPLSVVVCHLIFKFMFASLCRTCWKCFTSKQRVLLEWGNYVKKVAPTGITSGLDVGLSNWGLELITVSLYTMTKSTAIIFILGFALLFKLEEKSWTLVVIVGMISGGLFLFTYKATEFNFMGFILVLTASFTSGLRWTLAQLVMQKSKLGVALANNCKMFRYTDANVMMMTLLKITTGAVIAFCMEVTEYMVVTHTSSLTLSVAGIFKEICTLVLAVETGDQMNAINVVGLFCCLGGTLCHVLHKAAVANSSRSDEQLQDSLNDDGKTHQSDARVPLLADSAVMFTSGSINTTDESDEDSSNVLFNILQRRDNPR
ncbi:hypothetical protein C0J52_00210 [Blattella germanica]|nr:hypothetical protein C0J52_00210 [Blattella germanica]